jgi:tetratricopeptide (TPR) repeat protein
MHFLLAQLNLVSGRIDQAKSRFLDLAREQPTNPDVFASLGTIALRQNDRAEALDLWRRAIKLNVQDADLCYRYGLLADEAGLNIQEAKIGLERAIALAPNFDDARYHLALLEYRAADYRSALENLRKMAVPKDPRRLYGYWTAMASSLLELQENDEAHKVALQAAQAAQNDHDRAAALQMSYVASTELNVQFSTDADGRSRMVTTRIPRGAKDWNPFIEPSDSLQHARGKLSRVLCTNDKLTGFLLLTPNGAVTLDVADPSRVLMRNSPTEFYCGPVSDKSVAADYAVVKTPEQTRNILRGMTFDPQ